MADREPGINPLETASIHDLLGELNRRLIKDTQRPEAQALTTVLQGYTASLRPTSDEAQSDNPEDEFVQSVKGFAIEGKYPQGLSAKGRQFTPPQEWSEDVRVFSDISLIPIFEKRVFAVRSATNIIRDSQTLKDKHFLSVVPYVPNNDELKRCPGFETGHSLVIFSSLQDSSIRDTGRRHAPTSQTYLLMPTDKAETFITLVKDRPDGADIAERLLQKAVPSAMATKQGEPGVARVASSELLILDESCLTNVPNPNTTPEHQKAPLFNTIEQRAIRKPYAKPVGFGTAPS